MNQKVKQYCRILVWNTASLLEKETYANHCTISLQQVHGHPHSVYLKRVMSVCYRGATCVIDCSPNFVVLVQPQQQFLRFDNTVPSNKLLLCGVTIAGNQTTEKDSLSSHLVELGESRTLRPGDRLSISKSLSKHLVVRNWCPNYQRDRAHDFRVVQSSQLNIVVSSIRDNVVESAPPAVT